MAAADLPGNRDRHRPENRAGTVTGVSEKLFAALYRELADVQKSAVPATENPSGNPSVAASRFVPLGALGPVDDDFYLDLENSSAAPGQNCNGACSPIWIFSRPGQSRPEPLSISVVAGANGWNYWPGTT